MGNYVPFFYENVREPISSWTSALIILVIKLTQRPQVLRMSVGCTQDTENDIVIRIELNKTCGAVYNQMAPRCFFVASGV